MCKLANNLTSMLSFQYMTDMSIYVHATSCTILYVLFHFISNTLCWLGLWRQHREFFHWKSSYRTAMFLARGDLCLMSCLTALLEVLTKVEWGLQSNQSAAILDSLRHWNNSPLVLKHWKCTRMSRHATFQHFTGNKQWSHLAGCYLILSS